MKKKLTEDKIVDIVVYFLLAIIGIITVYPFYYTIICSLNHKVIFDYLFKSSYMPV